MKTNEKVNQKTNNKSGIFKNKIKLTLSIILSTALLFSSFYMMTGCKSQEITTNIGTLHFDGYDVTNVGIEEASKGEKFTYFEDLSSMLLALDAGQIDVSSIPECVAKYVNEQGHNYTINDTNPPMTVTYSMAIPEQNTDMIEKVNAAIDEITQNGELDDLIKEYVNKFDTAPVADTVQLPSFEDAETLRVVVTGDLPPFDYITPNGSPAGFNVAFLAAIGKHANLNIELVTSSSASRAAMISSGKADALFWTSKYEVPNSDGSVLGERSEDFYGLTVTNPYLTLNLKRIGRSK